MKTAIVTGVAGQDGSFLAESLLRQGFEVHGLVRPTTRNDIGNLKYVESNPQFVRHEIDLLEAEAITRLVRKVKPDEFYNLAACSFVPASWELPEYVTQINAVVPLRILEAIRTHSEDTSFYQAGSSEMFGLVEPGTVLSENSYHHPRSPYGVSKSFAHNITRNYRESFGLHACNGILFNHESERRDPRFVTRKITTGLAKWATDRTQVLKMGNMDSVRDWGYSPDYVEAMQMMVRHDVPDDWVVATGQAHSVRQFIEQACRCLGFQIQWEGSGDGERGFDQNGEIVVEVDPRFYRPAEVGYLRGDSRKIRTVLGWKEKTPFEKMVRRMMAHDAPTLSVASL